MIPVSLKLSNFTSYGENPPELHSQQVQLASIYGLNVTGKSSLLDSIPWCIWGTSRAGDSSDELVRLGQNEMQVEFSFELDGNQFTVKRKRSKKSGGHTALELWSASHNLTEGTIKATQQKIIDALHLSYETFTNSAFLRQGHADEFTTKGPTDRKRILADILGLDHYDKLEEKAKEKAKDAQTQLALLEYQLPEIEVELSQGEQSQVKKIETEEKIDQLEDGIKKIEKEMKNLQEEKAKLIAAYDQQEKIKQTFSELKSELNNITQDGKNRSTSIKDLEEELKNLPSFEAKLEQLKALQKQLEMFNEIRQKRLEIEKKISDLKGVLNLKNQQKETLSKKFLEIQQKIKGLEKEGAKCPVCGQEIGKDQKHQVKKIQLKEQKKIEDELSTIDTKQETVGIASLEKELRNLSLDDGEYRQILEKLKDLEEVQHKRELLIRKQATLESEKKTLNEMRQLFTNKKSQVEKLQIELDRLPSLSEDLDKVQTQISSLEYKLNGFRIEEKEARNILGQVVGLISRFEQLIKVKKELEGKKKKFTQEKETYEELSLAFGKKGIQAMIIENAIPEIEDEANRLLDRLT